MVAFYSNLAGITIYFIEFISNKICLGNVTAVLHCFYLEPEISYFVQLIHYYQVDVVNRADTQICVPNIKSTIELGLIRIHLSPNTLLRDSAIVLTRLNITLPIYTRDMPATKLVDYSNERNTIRISEVSLIE